MEQVKQQSKIPRQRITLYVATLVVLIGSLLLSMFHPVVYIAILVLLAFGGGPSYINYWRRGKALEVTLLVGALVGGGLLALAWQQLH